MGQEKSIDIKIVAGGIILAVIALLTLYFLQTAKRNGISVEYVLKMNNLCNKNYAEELKPAGRIFNVIEKEIFYSPQTDSCILSTVTVAKSALSNDIEETPSWSYFIRDLVSGEVIFTTSDGGLFESKILELKKR